MLRAISDRLREGPLLNVEWLFALLLSTAFGYFVATGFWLGAAAVVGLAGFAIVAMARPDALTLIWFVGMPTVFVFGNNAMLNVPFLTLDRGLFLAVIGLLIAQALTQPGSLQPWGRMEKVFGLFLLVTFASWATTFADKSGRIIWKDTAFLFDSFLMPFAACIIARNMTWTEARVVRFMWWFVAVVGGFLVIVGVLQYIFGWTFFTNLRYPSVHPDRVTGTFSNALSYGMVLSAVLIMALWLFLQSTGLAARVFLLGLAAGLGGCIVLSQGRAVWLAVPIALAYLFLRIKRIRALLMVSGLAVALAGPPLALMFLDVGQLDRRLGQASPVYNRIALYATALNMAADRPIFGYGFGESTFNEYKAAYYDTWGGVPAQYASQPGLPHNEFLNVTVMMGGVGLIAYLAVIWTGWRVLARRAAAGGEKESFSAELAVFVQGVFLVVMINALFMDLSEGSYYVLILFFFLIGILGRDPPGEAAETA